MFDAPERAECFCFVFFSEKVISKIPTLRWWQANFWNFRPFKSPKKWFRTTNFAKQRELRRSTYPENLVFLRAIEASRQGGIVSTRPGPPRYEKGPDRARGVLDYTIHDLPCVKVRSPMSSEVTDIGGPLVKFSLAKFKSILECPILKHAKSFWSTWYVRKISIPVSWYWGFYLTSEVSDWPRTLNLGITGFLPSRNSSTLLFSAKQYAPSCRGQAAGGEGSPPTS